MLPFSPIKTIKTIYKDIHETSFRLVQSNVKNCMKPKLFSSRICELITLTYIHCVSKKRVSFETV